MTEEKKDLTGLFDLPLEPVAEAQAETSAPDPLENPAQEAPQEQMENFENPDLFPPMQSLEELKPEVQASQEQEPQENQVKNPLEKIKEFSENTSSEKSAAVAAAFPFSLMIEGELSKLEQEKLIELITENNMGIRAVDLEPQFISHRILVPRISEYAGVLLVQALRNANVEMKFGPSELIFQSSELLEEKDRPILSHEAQQKESYEEVFSETNSHPAENIPIGFEQFLSDPTPSQENPEQGPILEILMASGLLKTQSIETESSDEYLELLEKLKKEIQYKAYRKGAEKILDFKVQLYPLPSPTLFRVLVMGTAVKPLPLNGPLRSI